MRRLVGALGQSKTVQEQAAKLLGEAQDADLFPGHSLESAAAAMVYAAGRCNTVIRMADVAAVAQCSEQEAWRTYRTFQTELEIPIPVQLPVDWVPKIVSELPYSIPSAIQQHATQLAATASKSAKLNGSPIGIAAASVYLAGEDADIRLTQQVISGAADISTVTLRTWYQRLVALFDT
ncbi:hypothetical protein ACODNH_01580 (plasmid) [Haloarcula sp. NS06]|uniref:hypothetical protein n=1 Tax=Haloarcula sp. NS06 TaxID=3409688 RepID=UPI003DA6F84F